MRDNAKGGALTEVTFFILLALHQPRHGYAVMQFVEERTGGRLALGAGTLYGALNALQEKGWIAPWGGDAGRKKEFLITDLGREALDEFEPAKRFGELLAGEPEGYRSAYDTVLACCEEGASKAAIEAALTGHPALAFPKQVYPGYFISKLETVDGISWDGVWRTTEAGQRMRALLA